MVVGVVQLIRKSSRALKGCCLVSYTSFCLRAKHSFLISLKDTVDLRGIKALLLIESIFFQKKRYTILLAYSKTCNFIKLINL